MEALVSQFPAPLPNFAFTERYNAIRFTYYALRKDPVTPHLLGDAYTVPFTAVDADGNQVAGIRLSVVEIPIGTYAGWNPRAAGNGEDDLVANSAGWGPFARTKEERDSSGDPRLSLKKRYGSRGAWAERVKASAQELAALGYLLKRDAEEIAVKAADLDIMSKP